MEKNDIDEDIYEYGVFVIKFNLLCIMTIIAMGYIFDQTVFTFYFLIFYVPIRVLLGGYHCKKPVSCYLTFNFIFLIILILNCLNIYNKIISVIGILLYLFAISHNIVKKNFEKSNFFLYTISAIFIIMFFLSNCTIYIAYALLLNALLYILNLFAQRFNF